MKFWKHLSTGMWQLIWSMKYWHNRIHVLFRRVVSGGRGVAAAFPIFQENSLWWRHQWRHHFYTLPLQSKCSGYLPDLYPSYIAFFPCWLKHNHVCLIWRRPPAILLLTKGGSPKISFAFRIYFMDPVECHIPEHTVSVPLNLLFQKHILFLFFFF